MWSNPGRRIPNHSDLRRGHGVGMTTLDKQNEEWSPSRADTEGCAVNRLNYLDYTATLSEYPPRDGNGDPKNKKRILEEKEYFRLKIIM